MESATVYLIRHCESQGNLIDIFGGNDPLSAEGNRQAKHLADSLAGVKFDAVYASDLTRAQQTAKYIADGNGLPVIPRKCLKERHYGVLENKTYAIIQNELKGIFDELERMEAEERLIAKWAPEMESEQETAERLMQCIRGIAAVHPGHTVAAVSHGAAIRALLSSMAYKGIRHYTAGMIRNGGYVVIAADEYSISITKTAGFDLVE